MKLRTGFVTNSSSSSFILNAKSLNVSEITKQLVYEYIRQLYLEYESKLKQIPPIIQRYNLKLDGYKLIDKHGKVYELYSNSEKINNLSRDIQREVGIDISSEDVDKDRQTWLNCEVYKDFELKCKESNYFPFTIVDYNSDNIENNHDAIGDAAWFADEHYIGNRDKVGLKLVLKTLGDVAIHSYCGNIPQYVVDRLTKVSNYSCNHMG